MVSPARRKKAENALMPDGSPVVFVQVSINGPLVEWSTACVEMLRRELPCGEQCPEPTKAPSLLAGARCRNAVARGRTAHIDWFQRCQGKDICFRIHQDLVVEKVRACRHVDYAVDQILQNVDPVNDCINRLTGTDGNQLKLRESLFQLRFQQGQLPLQEFTMINDQEKKPVTFGKPIQQNVRCLLIAVLTLLEWRAKQPFQETSLGWKLVPSGVVYGSCRSGVDLQCKARRLAFDPAPFQETYINLFQCCRVQRLRQELLHRRLQLLTKSSHPPPQDVRHGGLSFLHWRFHAFSGEPISHRSFCRELGQTQDDDTRSDQKPSAFSSASSLSRVFFAILAAFTASRLAGLSPATMSATMPIPQCGVHLMT